MDFVDVLFPLNIGPLTYQWHPGLGSLSAGMLVRAEVKTTLQHGLVLGRAACRPEGRTKEIAEIVPGGPVAGGTFLSFLKWMADYYLVPEGAVLKISGLTELCRPERTSSRPQKDPQPPPLPAAPLTFPPVSPRIAAPIRNALRKNEYRAFLLHAPGIGYQLSALITLIDGQRNVLILVPESMHIDLLAPALAQVCGDRLAVLHGKLTKSRRRQTMRRILSGAADIVLGTRIATLIPLVSVSLIVVLEEQNRSYKNLEGVRYHARDAAVMRGYLEKATVVLSSAAPSLESFHNTGRGKYILLDAHEEIQRPKIDVVDMRTSALVTRHLSRKAIQTASAALTRREKVLFLINRKGYSLIECAECGTFFTCPSCRIPLIYHKNGMILKCHYCSSVSSAPDTCTSCGGTKLQTVGAGTQRIAADVRKYLHIEPLRIDRDAIRDRAREGRSVSGEASNIIVGTKAAKWQAGASGDYRLCVLLNPDIGLHVPDFRSSELLFQEIIGMADYTRPEGLILVQTRMSENHVFRCARGYRFRDFYLKELSLRASLAYPPFSRLIVITFSSNRNMSSVLIKAFHGEEKIECIGPTPLPGQKVHAWKVILKSASKETLSRYARKALEGLRKEKGLRIAVDVDPIAI